MYGTSFCRLTGLCVGWLILVAGPAPGQSPKAGITDDPARLLAQARPHLEAVLGARIGELPRLKVVRPDEFNACPDPDLEAQIRWQFPDLQGDAWRQAVAAARNYRGSGCLARLCEETGVIWVCPANRAAIARWDKSLELANAAGFLQLSLVRESVREVLNRRYSLARLRAACPDADAYQALQAVVEGRVMQRTRQVAGRMGLGVYYPLFGECPLHVPEWPGDAAVRAVSQEAALRRRRAEQEGAAFWDQVQEHGIPEEQVFAAPPRQPTWIARPEFYVRAYQTRRADLGAALARLGPSLPPADWAASAQPWSPAMVRQAATLLGERDRADKVLAGWDEGRSLVWASRKDPARQVALSVVRLESGEAARAYFGFAVDLQRKQDTLTSNCTASLRVLHSRSTDLRLRRAEQAVGLEKRLQFGTAAPVPVRMLLARRGEVVIECTWYGVAADGAWAERVLDGLFGGGQ